MNFTVEEVNPNLPVTYARVLADGTIIEYNHEPRIVRKFIPRGKKSEVKRQHLNTQNHNIKRGDTAMEPSTWFRPLTEPIGRAIGVDAEAFVDVAGPELFAWLVQIPVNLFGRDVFGRKILYTILGGGLLAYASLAKPSGRAMRDTLHLATHFLNYAADFNWMTIGSVASGLQSIKESVAKGDIMGVLKSIFYTPEELKYMANEVSKTVSGLVGQAPPEEEEEGAEEDILKREIERLRAELQKLRASGSVSQHTPKQEESEREEEWFTTSV